MKQIFAICIIAVLLVLAGCQKAGSEQAASGSAATMDELKDVFNARQTVKYTATYKTTTAGVTATQKWAVDGTKVAISTDMAAGKNKVINDGARMVICTQPSGSWMCLESETDPQEQAGTDVTVEDLEEYKAVAKGSCSVAGETGIRVSLDLGPEAGVMEQCITRDGILLQITSSMFSITATSVSRTVDASEFTPPAKVMTYDEYVQSMMG